MKLIDKDALVAEIKRRRNAALTRQKNLESIGQETILNEMVANELNRILSFINTLEVKEVDFIKEFYAFSEKHKLMDKDIEFSDIEKTASFFFQLGLKAQKGE